MTGVRVRQLGARGHRVLGQDRVEDVAAGREEVVDAGAVLDRHGAVEPGRPEGDLADRRGAARDDPVEQPPAGELDDAAAGDGVRRQRVRRRRPAVEQRHPQSAVRQEAGRRGAGAARADDDGVVLVLSSGHPPTMGRGVESILGGRRGEGVESAQPPRGSLRVGEPPVEPVEQPVGEPRRDQVEQLADVARDRVHVRRPPLQGTDHAGGGLLGGGPAPGVRLGRRGHRGPHQREPHVGEPHVVAVASRARPTGSTSRARTWRRCRR